MKKELRRAAKACVTSGAELLAITDPNDQELAGRARLAVLLPALSEVTGALLSSILLGCVAQFAGSEAQLPKPREHTGNKGPE